MSYNNLAKYLKYKQKYLIKKGGSLEKEKRKKEIEEMRKKREEEREANKLKRRQEEKLLKAGEAFREARRSGDLINTLNDFLRMTPSE